MAIYPGAIWEPISGGTDGPMSQYLGLVLHVNDSDGADLFGWENGGTHDMSSHFQIAKDGRVFQYLDTSYDSWCQADGNGSYLSVETEGYPTEALTDAQVKALAGLYAWAAKTHGIPFQLAETPGQRGFGWHGMGGSGWGGHTGCPGDLRKAQRQQVLQLAQQGAPASDWLAMATLEEVKAVVDERVSFYVERLPQVLRKGQGNKAFGAGIPGVDGKGVDGRLDDLAHGLTTVINQLTAVLTELKKPEAELDSKAVTAAAEAGAKLALSGAKISATITAAGA